LIARIFPAVKSKIKPRINTKRPEASCQKDSGAAASSPQ